MRPDTYRGYVEVVRDDLHRRVIRARLRLASWIMGDRWWGAVSRLQLIRQRAEIAITRDGSVILADCPALAEALYEDIPGSWTLTVSPTPPTEPRL